MSGNVSENTNSSIRFNHVTLEKIKTEEGVIVIDGSVEELHKLRMKLDDVTFKNNSAQPLVFNFTNIDDIDNNNYNSTSFGNCSAPSKNSDYLDGLIEMNGVEIISNNFGGYLIETQYLKMKWKNCVIENNTS